MINKNNRQTLIAYALTCGLLLFFFLLCAAQPKAIGDSFLKEGGVIESASVLIYFLSIAYIVCKRRVLQLKHFFILIIFFMLRELDFHKRFTTMGIFKIKFFISAEVPLVEKYIGIMVILLLLYTAVSMVLRYKNDFYAGIRKRSAVSFGIVLVSAFMVLAKSIDGLGRKLKVFGIVPSEQTFAFAKAFEEIAELGIPIVIFLMTYAYFQNMRASGIDDPRVRAER
jgi:hypothetical protein